MTITSNFIFKFSISLELGFAMFILQRGIRTIKDIFFNQTFTVSLMQTSDFHRETACQTALACNYVKINLQWFRLIRWKIGLHNLQKQFSGFHTKKAVFNDLSYLNSFKHTGTNFYMCGPGKEILCINFLHLRNNSKISYSQLPGIPAQTLLAACRRFAMVRISDNGPGRK